MRGHPLFIFFIEVLLPVALTIYFFIADLVLLAGEGEYYFEDTPVLFLRFFGSFILLPIVLVGDLLSYFGIIHSSPGSDYWQVKLFTRVLYVILAMVAVIRLLF